MNLTIKFPKIRMDKDFWELPSLSLPNLWENLPFRFRGLMRDAFGEISPRGRGLGAPKRSVGGPGEGER
jgi:hypothetical protein